MIQQVRLLLLNYSIIIITPVTSTTTGNLSLSLNKWYNIMIISDFSTKKTVIKISNTLAVSYSTTLTLVLPSGQYNSISLGAEALGNNYINAYINDFRLYNTALTDSPNSQLSNFGQNIISSCTNLDNDQNLISFYTFKTINTDNNTVINNKPFSLISGTLSATLSSSTLIPPPNLPPLGGKKYSTNSNGYIVFMSPNDNLRLENSITISQNYTICFWFYYTIDGNIITLFNGINNFINIRIDKEQQLYLTIGFTETDWKQIVTINKITAATWHHIALVFNSEYDVNIPTNNINCYIDSVLNKFNNTNNIGLSNFISTSTSTLINIIGNINANPLPIKTGYPLTNNSFIGGFTDLRIFKRSLTSSEILLIFNKP